MVINPTSSLPILDLSKQRPEEKNENTFILYKAAVNVREAPRQSAPSEEQEGAQQQFALAQQAAPLQPAARVLRLDAHGQAAHLVLREPVQAQVLLQDCPAAPPDHGAPRLQDEADSAAYRGAGLGCSSSRALGTEQPDTEAPAGPTVLSGQAQGATGTAQSYGALGLQALGKRAGSWRGGRARGPRRGSGAGGALVLVLVVSVPAGNRAGAGQVSVPMGPQHAAQQLLGSAQEAAAAGPGAERVQEGATAGLGGRNGRSRPGREGVVSAAAPVGVGPGTGRGRERGGARASEEERLPAAGVRAFEQRAEAVGSARPGQVLQRECGLRARVPVRVASAVVSPCLFVPGVSDCSQSRAGHESRGDAELGDAVRGEHVWAPGGLEGRGSAGSILVKPVSAPQEALGSQEEPLQAPH